MRRLKGVRKQLIVEEAWKEMCIRDRYEAIHGCWCKAIKVLPYFCVVHKQDWFIKEKYMPELQKDDMSFLSRSFERHFNERPYLKHSCYLYLTKTTKERNRMQSNFSTLCRGHILSLIHI